MKDFRLYLLLPFSLINLFSQNLFASNKDIDRLDSTLVFEKVYLHTDRSLYITGENIWFKAYLVDASTNRLIDHSKNLYIELIDQNSKIAQKRNVQIEDGVGFGDFQIGDSAKSGIYLLRAYTNWMRNFGDTFFFEKEISIANSTDSDQFLQKKFLVDQSGIDIQFFPEGGSLVDSIPTNIAFKAIDTGGMGINTKGVIKAKNGQVVTSFESSHLGMGVFNFTPHANETYTAEGTTASGQEFVAKLPNIFKTGVIIQVNEKNDKKITLAIKVNPQTLQSYSDSVLQLKTSSHNQGYSVYQLKITSLVNEITIPTTNLPEGISKITILNNTGKPQCERLIYINKTPNYKISITADKSLYFPRSEVKLNVSVSDSLGEPELATLSLSAVDANLVKNSNLSNSDIVTYLLLESEIKGHIEQPEYYFDSKNEDRWKKLELLLLTQGWRDFIWKYLPDKSFTPQYFLESGITISGKVRKALIGKPIDKTNVSLTLFEGSKKYHYLTQTDTHGCFYFDSLYFSGTHNVILSANSNNKLIKELITLDSANYCSPNIDYSYPFNSNDFLSTITQLKNESIYQKLVKKKYFLKDTIMLDEIIVNKYRPQKGLFRDNHNRIYNYFQVDARINVKENDAGRSSVFDLIQSKVAGVYVGFRYDESGAKIYTVKIGGLKQTRDGDATPLLLLDGVPTTIDLLVQLPVYMIDKIEIIKRNASFYGTSGYNGIISVFTKEGKSFYYPPLNTISTKVKGYDVPRIFFSPKYSTPNNEADKPDLRNTIYWDPNIVTTNEKGETVNYFNADKATTIEVNVEGITRLGVPVRGSLKYDVRNSN